MGSKMKAWLCAALCGFSAFYVIAATPSVTYTTDIVSFRKDFDRYAVYDYGTINGGGLEIVMTKGNVKFTPHPYVPPMPVDGPSSVTVTTTAAPENGEMTLRLRDLAAKKEIEFRAPWRCSTRFDVNLDSRRKYSLHTVAFSDPGYSTNFRFRVMSVSGCVASGQAGACTLDVDTGSPLHTVDWPIAAAPVAVVRNRSGSACAVSGDLVVSDYFGRSFSIPFKETLEGGTEKRVAIPCGKGGVDAKGVWMVSSCLKGDDGSSAEQNTSFGVIDRHDVTEKWPYGRFRWGIHMHVIRHMPSLRPLTMDAAVRMGAKIVRIDGVFSGFSVWDPRKKAYDWTAADAMLGDLEKRGLAVNAIVFENRGKYSTPEFYRQIAARYGERIDYYEVGNEWDLYRKEHMTPDRAVEVHKEAYISMKKGNAKARVITNGWAVEDSAGHANVTQKGFQEQFMREAKGFYDLHAMHLHFRFEDYVERLDRFFAMRRHEGVDAPWLLNETALSVQYRGQREVAENVWKKILYAWGAGAKDYIWYAQRASAPDPGGIWGIMTYDYRPRLHYAAFSAFSKVFGACRDPEVLAVKNSRYVYRLGDMNGAKITLAGWDGAALAPMPVRVRTDASSVYLADIMNNTVEVPVVDGEVTWPLVPSPTAMVFEGATFARPGASELAAAAVYSPRVIFVEKVRPDYGWDMRLANYAQVKELYPADPATVHRTWKGEQDLSGTLIFLTDGKSARVKVSVKDEKDVPDGDRIEIWRDGVNITSKLDLKRVRHGDNRTVYDASWPYMSPCRVNVRFVDDDGFGGIDGWMDYEPFDSSNPAFGKWPIVRFD